MSARQAGRSAGALSRLAARLFEKIEFNLLLPDLSLQLTYPSLGRTQLGRRRCRLQFCSIGLTWSMCRAKPLSSITAIIRPPLRKIIRTDLQLLRDLCAALAGHQPPYRRELDLPVENSPFCCGHPALPRDCYPCFCVSFSGCTPAMTGWPVMQPVVRRAPNEPELPRRPPSAMLTQSSPPPAPLPRGGFHPDWTRMRTIFAKRTGAGAPGAGAALRLDLEHECL